MKSSAVSGSPSDQSPDWRSRTRGVEAMRNVTHDLPAWLTRGSGAGTRLPTTVISGSPGIK